MARTETRDHLSVARGPIRFAEPNPWSRCRFEQEAQESDAPEFLCIDCGEVEVSDEGERCAECWAAYDDNRRDDYADRQMSLREGR